MVNVTTSLLPFGQNSRTVGGPGSGAQFSDIQSAVDSISDSSATKPYTVLHIGGTITVPDISGGVDFRGVGGSKDYINFGGLNRETCLVNRPVTAAGVTDPVIQTCPHMEIFGLTFDAAVSRLIHWDTVAGSHLSVHDCYARTTGGAQTFVAAGMTGDGSILEVRNNLINGDVGIHNGPGASTDVATFILQGNDFIPSQGFAIDIDMSPQPNGGGITAFLAGNSGDYANVDSSHAVLLKCVDAGTARLLIHADGPGHHFLATAGMTKMWNKIIWPQSTRYQSTTATAEADVVAVTPAAGADIAEANCGRVASANTRWPAVVIEQLNTTGTSGWVPRLATGAMAEVICDTGAVVIGDILVTSATSAQATVNNAQTDPTRILGWAVTAKSGGSSGRVTVKMNRMINGW